jgi:hypothetical protein
MPRVLSSRLLYPSIEDVKAGGRLASGNEVIE